MERLPHDLNLALEESNCNKGRKKFGLRRRTRSTGNLPVTCIAGIGEDGSSSSPPQPAIISNELSDSDDPQLNQLQQGNRVSHYCPGGNFESDSFNENFSPAKPPNARRKRKFKKMAIDYPDHCNGKSSPPLLLGTPAHINVKNCSVLNLQGSTSFTLISKKKRIFKLGCQDGNRSNAFCGKRKWSHRERSELGEMRERSFSGGCASKSYFCGKTTSKSFLDFKNSKKYLPIDKVPKFKDKILAPVKSAGMKNGLESALQSISLSSFTPSQIPGSSSFNFVYRPPATTCDTTPISKNLPKPPSLFSVPFFAFPDNDAKNQNAKTSKKHEKSHSRKHKSHLKSNEGKLRNPLQFDDSNIIMDYSTANDAVSSSSISSSDSEGVVTNDSDREGDDELTDWPGNEEISSFSKNLNLKGQRPSPNGLSKTTVQQSAKTPLKKDKFLPKQGLSSCKNKTDPVLQKTDVNLDMNADIQLMEDDTMMSDAGSVLDTYSNCVASPNEPTSLTETYTSFADVKNAGLLNNNVNEAFFHSFSALHDGKYHMNKEEQYIPRTNFTLQKTSSSDLNLSEKSPQSDHCYSEHSASFGLPAIRKLRAGCRRLRDERPGFTILSAANEQLSRFLQDSCQDELKLPCFNNDLEEKEKLASLAKMYSLDMSVELGRPVLRKTSNTTQSIRVEHSRLHCQRFFASTFKRRCYDECSSEPLFSLPLDICSTHLDPNKPIILPVDHGMCSSSTNKTTVHSQEPFLALAKAPTLNDLTQSQDYDQGFSEPSLRNSPHLDASDELKTRDKSDGGFSSD